jgi:DNA-binding beta-propeller fold protein YncE
VGPLARVPYAFVKRIGAGVEEVRVKRRLSCPVVATACGGLAIAVTLCCPPPSRAQAGVPKFEVDPYWPKPLPERWVTGEIGGVCVDSRDHVFIAQRVNDVGGMDGHLEGLTNDELNAGQAAPSVIEFDVEGNVVNSWGDPSLLPKDLHGCAIDHDDHVWLDGSEDGIVQEYSHDGRELLLQIGKRGVFDSSDGTVTGTPLNSSTTQFFRVSEIAFDPHNGDVYVADGHAKGRGGNNFRIVVFDQSGHYLRQWKVHRSPEEVGTAVAPTPHCVRVSSDGLVYVCDRWMNRVQVFDTMGNFQKNIPFTFKVWTPIPATGTGSRREAMLVGSASSVEFSRDQSQKFMYVINEIDEQIEVVDRASGHVLESFGRPGHQVGEFMHAHTMAQDSKGNIYVGESVEGRRVQKFKMVGNK